jgi:protein-tyrosine phosphatase
VTSVLFVCLGNICRSPYAERVLARRGNGALRVHSAGFIGPGRRPPPEALEVARARGIEHAEHVSRTLTRELLEGADVLFVFDRHLARRVRSTAGARADRILWLGDFDPEWAGKRAIADPWGKPVEEFQRTFARIERCVDALVDDLG